MNAREPVAERPEIIYLNVTDQVFSFTDSEGWEWHWNASEGMRIVEASGRKPLAFYPSDHGLDIPHLQRQYETLDLEYARGTDVSRPILFVPFWNGTSVLADGWHRLAHAILIGVPFLLCHELTQEEADQILVMKIPPKPEPAMPQKLEPMVRPTPAPKKGGQRKP